MAKRDVSRSLGGASGQAASALRSRKSRLDSLIDAASGPTKGGKAKKIVVKEGRSGRKAYR